MTKSVLLLLLLLLSSWSSPVAVIVRALISPDPVPKLLQQHAAQISALKQQHGSDSIPAAANDVFWLRFCLCDNPDEAVESAMEWRTSASGRAICTAAATAVQQATGDKNKWNNEPILTAAPHSEIISKFITPSNCITTTTTTTGSSSAADDDSDLVYCIRAGAIDDVGLMNAVTVDQMVDFFLYVKEVNSIVADMRSAANNHLVSVITCNDLRGVKLVGGSADFRKALSTSSNIASTVYYNLAGPTLLLNLPTLLSALVKLFTPLFPASVKERLKFKQGLLKDVDNLRDIASTSSLPARTEFVSQLDSILNKNAK